MKAWVKGGIIGGIIGLIAGYWTNVCSEFSCIPALPFSVGNIIILAISGPTGSLIQTTSVQTQETLGLILNILLYILIGALVGLIIQKIKSKKN